MNELLNHIKTIKEFVNTEKDMTTYTKHKLIESFFTGRLFDVLPPAIYEDVVTFSLEQISDNSNKVLVGLKTKNESAIVFKYSIVPNSNSITFELDSYAIPSKAYSIDFPDDTNKTCLLIDVSSID